MSNQNGRNGPGHFQWNGGGWIGSAFGSTAWMLVVACFLTFSDDAELAVVPTAGFLIANCVAIHLWQRRDRTLPFTGYMILLGVLAVIVPTVWITVESFASQKALTRMNWPSSVTSTIFIVFFVPMIMLWFVHLERQAKVGRSNKRPNSADDRQISTK